MVNAFDWWAPLFGLFGFAVVIPVWAQVTETYLASQPIEIRFFANLSMPMLAALLLASWADPESA